MPPKKDKALDNDFTNLHLLPKAHIFKFQIAYSTFYSQANRDKVTAKVQESLVSSSGERVKVLSREDITTYGKGKAMVMDNAAAMALAEDNILHGLPTEELFAKCAAEKLFEMTVNVRRFKKERITKIEEEAAAKTAAGAVEEAQALEAAAHAAADEFDLDAMFYLPDYPSNKAEALAFAKYSNSLNGVFNINEQPRPVNPDEDEEEEEDQEEGDEDEDRSVSKHEDQVVLSDGQANEDHKSDTDNQDERDKASFLVDELEQARAISSKCSPLRQMAFLKVPFIDEAVITEEPGVDSAEPIEKKQPSEEVFLGDLITQHLDKFGQFYIQYLKFREVVTAEPLMPDQRAISELSHLNEEENIYMEQKQENEQQLDEEQNQFNLEVEKLTGEELDAAQAEFAEVKAQFEVEANATLAESKSRRDRMGQLQWRKNASVDEERNFDQFSTAAYKKDFVENNETSNKISSVLSAMITQIEANPEQKDSTIPQGRALSRNTGDNASALTMDDSNLDDLFEHFNREISCDLRLAARDRDAAPTKNSSVRLESTYNKGIQLHEESDKTLEAKQALPLKLVEDESDRIKNIEEREHEVLTNLNLPGKCRYLMPTIPAKSKRMRDSENPAFYPFCTLSHDEAERTLMLRALQQLVRSNFIDNKQGNGEKHAKFKVFERNFENHMKPEIFKQVFAEALLDEPDVASMYYQRQDSLIVALFNKAKAATNAPDAATPMGENLDGERTWRAAYRVVPDFQNWLTFFSDELVFEQEAQVIPREDKAIITSSQPTGTNPGDTTGKTVGGFMKYQMDEDAMPERMLDIEDDKIQSLQERSGLLYPDDNSIMRVDHFSVGGQDFSKSVIMKDNLRFGLRERAVMPESKADAEMYGLVSYKMIGDTEFWLQFENGTRLGVEQVKLCRNGQMTVRVEPPPPTAEEIAAKEEAIKAYQAQQVKSQRSGGKVTNDIEIPKTPEPTWEEEPMNHLDELYSEDMIDQNTSLATLTLSNGLFVQYLGNGQVSQTTQELIGERNVNEAIEIARVCTKEGAIIRQFSNRDAEVLYPDGETARFNKLAMTWTIVNNKGKKRTFANGVYQDCETIPCAHETDPDTLAVMMIREDNVVSVKYPDEQGKLGGLFVQHADGTQMYTNGNEIRIEKQGLASHRVRNLTAQEQEEFGGNSLSPRLQAKGTPALKVEERAIDGRVLETFLPDGAMSQTYLDVVETVNRGQEERYRHIIKRPDLSVIVIDGSGHISLIGSNTRAALCDNGSKTKCDHSESDRDYLVELSRMAGTFSPGIYQAYVSAKDCKSKIKTMNANDATVFTLNYNNTLTKSGQQVNLKSSIGSQKSSNHQAMPQATVIGDLEIEDTQTYVNPLTRQYQYPRFFVVAGDGSAKELLSTDQLSYAMRKKKVMDEQSIKQKMSDVVNNATVENHYFLTKVVNMKETELENQKLRDLEFPANAADTLAQKTPDEELALQLPRQEQYLYTQIFEMPDMDSFSQKAFANDYQRYQEWKMSQVRQNTEFGIVRRKHDPTNTKQRQADVSISVDSDQIEEDEFNGKRIAIKILKFRCKPNSKLEAEEFKQMSLKDMNGNKEVKEFQEKCQATHSSLVSRGSQRMSDKEEQRVLSAKVEAEDSGLDADSEIGGEEKEQMAAQNQMIKDANAKVRTDKLEAKLDGMSRMKNTPSFEPEYFMSHNGNQFLHENPPKELSPEVIMRMEQRLKRQNQKESKMDGESAKGAQDENMEGEQINDKDNPIVALEPEDGLKKGSAFMGSKKGQSISQHQQSSMSTGKRQEEIPEEYIDPSMVPSLYAQEKMYLAQKEKEELLRSEEHHIVKTKEFDVTGRLRKQMPFVKATVKSKADSELNEKFITTECITDRRVKISSMSGRHYAQAPSVEMVRKQGQHQMILGAINKKQTFAELINQANSMVTGVLHDPLKRSLNVMPSQAVFGGVRAGTHNEIIFTLKNEDSIGHRITVKPCNDKRVVIQQLEHGVIAPGMTRKISVGIRVTENEPEGRISDQLCIVTKHETFKIPITAEVHLFENFDEADNAHRQTMGKSLQNGRVRERLLRQVTESRQGSRQDSHPELLTKKPKDDEDSDHEGLPSDTEIGI